MKRILLLALVPAIACSVTRTPPPSFAKNVVVAHRGAFKKNNLPENSIASLKQAIALGCTGSEFDIRMTKDDSLIINHDPHYNKLLIEDETYDTLLQFPLSNGEKLPTLREYLLAGLTNNHTTRLICEIKPSGKPRERADYIVTKVVELVHALKAEKKVAYISFDYEMLKKIIAINPTAITQYLNGDKSPQQLKADKISGADYHYSVFRKNPGWISSAKKNNIQLNAWTVNDTANIDWLLANHFDMITTNEPELVLKREKENPVRNRQLVWADEFDYRGLPDSSKWNYDTGGHGWGNNELQFYTLSDSSNALVKDGKLFITALKQDKEGKKYTSARLITKNKGDWQYGRVEVMAKLPAGKGMWPAIWMLPTDWAYGDWPQSGEIDIMENVGYIPDTVYASVHTKSFNHMIGTQKTNGLSVKNFSGSFHLYAIEWNADKIDFYIDNQRCLRFQNTGKGFAEWPFDKRFHLLLNIAVGGNWGGKFGVDDNIFPGVMEVDYVRVFQ